MSQIVWVYLHSNLSSGLQKTHLFCDRVRFGVQGHPRSMILVPIESVYATSYKSCFFIYLLPLTVNKDVYIIVTMVLSCTAAEITATYWLKIAYFSYPCLIRHPRSLCSLWHFALKMDRWGSKSNNAIPYFYPILPQIGTHVMHFQWET